MAEPFPKLTVVWVWKLHTDTGTRLTELAPFFKDDVEHRYFRVEGKKRPAIVWTSNSTKSKLIMLTTQYSEYAYAKLVNVLGDNKTAYFNPSKERFEWYPHDLVESVCDRISDSLERILIEEVQQRDANGAFADIRRTRPT